jgi:hypothetical protein
MNPDQGNQADACANEQLQYEAIHGNGISDCSWKIPAADSPAPYPGFSRQDLAGCILQSFSRLRFRPFEIPGGESTETSQNAEFARGKPRRIPVVSRLDFFSNHRFFVAIRDRLGLSAREKMRNREGGLAMSGKKRVSSCPVCNPDSATGEYCDEHREELHKLEHLYESFMHLRRTSRGKDHEAFDVLMQGECEPFGRILVSETIPDNLSMTMILAHDLDLETPLPGYEKLGLRRTWGDYLRDKIQQEIVHCWYGNARACLDVFPCKLEDRQHWDLESREEESEEEEFEADLHGPTGGGRHSIH